MRPSGISEDQIVSNLEILRERIVAACGRVGRSPERIKLIAVTKNVSAGDVQIAFKYGVRDFGENRLQEAQEKFSLVPELREQSTLHYIGHLQTNKVVEVSRLFDVIDSIDSLKLARKINMSVLKKIPVLIQLNISGETTKFGFCRNEVIEKIENIRSLNNLVVRGLMTIAPFAEDTDKLKWIFSELRRVKEITGLEELSMGMSDDFEVAIEEGATMLRIGRAIFGERRK